MTPLPCGHPESAAEGDVTRSCGACAALKDARRLLREHDAPRCGRPYRWEGSDEDGPIIDEGGCEREEGHADGCYIPEDHGPGWDALRVALAEVDRLAARLPHRCDAPRHRYAKIESPDVEIACADCGAPVAPAAAIFGADSQQERVEWALHDRVYAVFGLRHPEDDPPWSHLTWDYYDTSLEIKRAHADFAPTAEQWAAIRALGFSRMWVCYSAEDGEEIHSLERYYYDGEHSGLTRAERGAPSDDRDAVARVAGREEDRRALCSRVRMLVGAGVSDPETPGAAS